MNAKLTAVVAAAGIVLSALAGWMAWLLGGPASSTWIGVALVLIFPHGFFLRVMIRARKGQYAGWVWMLLAATTLLVATWLGVGYFGRITTITLTPGEKEPLCTLRVSEGDRALGELHWPGETSLQFRGGFDYKKLVVKMRTPMGWVDRPVFETESPFRLLAVPAEFESADLRGEKGEPRDGAEAPPGNGASGSP